MNLKRYRRESIREALQAVRDELGSDALILDTRRLPAPGVRGWLGRRVVEVTAAADRPLVSDRRHARVDPPAKATRAANEIVARLQAVGLDSELSRRIVAALPVTHRRGATSQSIREELARQLATLAAGDEDYAPVEVFIGPPGVGKTTTIAKIAAQERARRGRRLGLMSADGFRVGAVEQLRLYADILGTPLAVARTARELETALNAARRPLLLDTAGRSPAGGTSREMLRMLAGRRDVRTHLVVDAGTPLPAARRIFDRFEEARPSRLVLTKLDEAELLAPMVSLLRERQLPVSYLGTGQGVPEDLERATPSVLAAWVAGDGRRGADA